MSETAFAMDLPLERVIALVAEANERRDPRAGSGASASRSDAERLLEEIFSTSQRLAVYGSLAPGRSNHHVVAPLGGEWTDGCIEGDLLPVGWGAALGFNAFRPRLGGGGADSRPAGAIGMRAGIRRVRRCGRRA